MLGPVSKQRLELVHPTVRELAYLLAAKMSEPIGVTQGLRSDEEQLALWMQGRMSLDVVNGQRAKVGWGELQPSENIKTVTNAKPGYSWHPFGLAVDLVPFESNGAPDWNDAHPVWVEMIETGTKLGFVSGKSWKDEPHFQWTCQYPVTPTDEVRQLYEQGGLKAVWDSLKR